MLRLWRNEIARREFGSFIRLGRCDEVSDRTLTIISDHIEKMMTDFKQRFVDLDEMDFPGWLTDRIFVG